MLSPEDRKLYQKLFRTGPLSKDVYFPNKRAVRITVIVPSTDRSLKRWVPWARKRLEKGWLANLNRTGGGKHESWYLYFGTIPPAKFRDIEVL